MRRWLSSPDELVTSPSYLIDIVYPDESGAAVAPGVTVHHMDLWRLPEGKISQLVDDISSLTLLEASELSEARERAFSPALFFVWRRRPFRVGGLLLGMAISPLGVCVCRLRILRVSRLRTLRASLSRVLEPPLDFGTSN